MSATTTYDVRLRYMMDSAPAVSGVRAIAAETRAAAQSSGLLASGLAQIGAMAAGAFGLNQARKALVDYNSSMEQAKITAAGLLQLNIGGSWTDNMSRATEVVSRLQQEAKTSVGTTADMVQMFSMLAQPLSQAGAGMDDFVNLTKASVVASRAMGIAAEVAALDVSQALRGQFNARDRFTGSILGPIGYAGEAGRAKYNALPDAKRLSELRRAEAASALAEMANAQGTSFAGVLSTFQDNLQIAFGHIGLPLFRQITAEIQRWNKWLENNEKVVNAIIKDTSQWLTEAFSFMKDAVKFLVDNKGTILTLAQVWAGVKIGGVARGVVGGIGGGAASLLGSLGGSAETAGLTLGRWLGPAGIVVGALAGFVTEVELLKAHNKAIQAPVVEAANKFMEGRRFLQGGVDVNADAVNEVARQVATFAKDQGLLTDDFSQFKRELVNGGLLSQALDNLHFNSDKDAVSVVNAVLQLSRDVASGMVDLRAILGEEDNKPADIPARAPNAEKPKVTINIHRIEVATDDPDAFAFRMVETFRDAARNPGSAKNTLPER